MTPGHPSGQSEDHRLPLRGVAGDGSGSIRPPARPDFNILIRGDQYDVDLGAQTVTGEYLGVESPHGERSMLLRHRDGVTSSIPFRGIVSITPGATQIPG